MADETRGRTPRRKSRPRRDKKIPAGPSTRHTPGDRIEELAMTSDADLADLEQDTVGNTYHPGEDRDEREERDSERGNRRPEERRPESRPEPRQAAPRPDAPREPRHQARREDRAPRREEHERGNREEYHDEGDGPERSADGDAPAGEPRRAPQGPRTMPEEEFAVQIFYDRPNGQYFATCIEFPDLKVTANRRDDAVEELTQKIGDELEIMRREGKPLPAPFAARVYPEKLEVRLSKNLYRRLDMQSRHDRVPLDQLVTELLTIALNKRPEGFGRQQDGRRPQGQGQGQGQGHQGKRDHGNGGGNRRGGGGGGGGGGGRGQRDRNYHDTMGNRDNFMEYVRNLEKTGGYKKR